MEIRPRVLRADADEDRRASSASSVRAPCASSCPTARRASTISCTADRVRQRATSKTSSSSAPTATRPTTSPSSSDDVEMKITHVVRGDDHISNTPKQVLLYRGGRRAGAAVRARAADSRARQEAPEQAARRDVGDGVRAAGISARSDGEFPRAARLVARRGDREAVHARRADARSSTSTASAAATRCSTPRSSTGSTSSTSRGSRPTSSRVRVKPLLEAAGLWNDDSARRSARVVFRRARAAEAARASGSTNSSTLGRFFFTDRARVRQAAVEEAPRSAGMRGAPDGGRRGVRGARRRSIRRRSRRRCARLADARGVKAATLIHAVRVAVTGKSGKPGPLRGVVAARPRARASRASRAAIERVARLPPESTRRFSSVPRQVTDPLPVARRSGKRFPSARELPHGHRKTFST